MKIEHFALQVADPIAVARWYVVHLGMTIQRGSKEPPFAHFLADDGGQMLIEIYYNDNFDVPNQANVPPAHFHLALVSDNIEQDRARLIEAGANPFFVQYGRKARAAGIERAFTRLAGTWSNKSM